jgi:hypothetical protein
MPKASIRDKRYRSVIRRLDLSKAGPAKRKFIVIQIDSLPFSTLKTFLEKGSCRYIRHLLENEGYSLQKWNCGVPSGTPHIQSGIMYGDNSMVPGFRFVDKKNKKQVSFGNPNHVHDFEQRFFSGKDGILKGGSSYSNHFSGGAEHSILTMSTITKRKRLKRIKESTLWLFLVLYPASALRVIYYAVSELLIEAGEVLAYPLVRLFSRRKIIWSFWIPFRRLLMNAIMAELITLGVILDVKRGVPKIYINYMNYDDIAHLRGPDSTAAYFMVRALDRRVKRICLAAGDGYDIHVISDHGQVPAVPFRILNKMTLPEFVEQCTKVQAFGLSSAFEGRLTVMGIMMDKTIDFLKYVSAPLRWVGTSFAKGIKRLLKPNRREFVWEDKEKIFILDSCCLAGVYFNVSEERMDIGEIEAKYPGIVEKLLSNRGIGIVLAKDGEDVILFGKKGKITIRKEGFVMKGDNFLKAYGDEAVLIKQLREYSGLKFVGDLVLFGNYVDGLMVSFTDHVGAHGGIGGDMTAPFFISKRKHDLSKVTNARELHRIFSSY